MKLQVWMAIGAAVVLAGCNSSSKHGASRHEDTVLAANGSGVRVSGPNVQLAATGFDESGEFDDFDLLEEEAKEKITVPDPLEGWNRMMFGLNDRLYFWVVKPIANTYKGVAPKPARVGIRNFFHNLTTPVRFVNCLLQNKRAAAGKELYRFAINTTEGVLGFGDPARDKHGLMPTEEDLGQTLATWGWGDGVYVVWPLLGPSTLRDSTGIVGDQFLNPVRYVDPREASIAISAGKMINERSFYIGDYESFKASALEPYVAMREAYLQYRAEEIEK